MKREKEVDPHGGTVPPASGEARADEFAPGCVIGGKYLVERTIGEGGLGVVLQAKHQQLDQPVAIKHLKPFASALPEVVERFLREARLAAKIKNEHAVKVHDVDALPSGVPYMVMEYLEGRDLEQVVAQAPLSVPIAIDYVLQAIEALAEAHGAGIVHRDLKPANLFLASHPGKTSIVKVLDFGISKVTTGDPQSTRRVTRIDQRIGTPEFMSPEQLQAAPDVDARSDIWSLGVVLYELVTGKLPFDGPDLPQLCVAVLTKTPVPLSALNADAPPELEHVIERCLQKDRAKRYQNVAELAQDLAQIWEGETPSRVQQIARVISQSGQPISPPTPFPGSIDDAAAAASAVAVAAARPQAEAPPVAAPQEVRPDQDVPAEKADEVVDDQVLAMFFDEAGTKVDELEFLSIDEAYDYAASQEPGVVRCELYDHFAGVRGKLRVSYVRRPETGHWVPVIQ